MCSNPCWAASTELILRLETWSLNVSGSLISDLRAVDWICVSHLSVDWYESSVVTFGNTILFQPGWIGVSGFHIETKW